MGKYYGIVNKTKQEQVSGYWKGSPPGSGEIVEIMHMLKWDKTDDIRTISSSDAFKYHYGNRHFADEEGNVRTVLGFNLVEYNPNSAFTDETEVVAKPVYKKFGTNQSYSVDDADIDESSTQDKSKIYTGCSVAEWHEDTCANCGFKFTEENKDYLSTLFDPVFFMN